MAIYIDSANLDEAKAAQALGWVFGVTTNPLLLAKAGQSPQQILDALTELQFKEVFYQLVSTSLETMQMEADRVSEIVGSPLILKIPPTILGFEFVSRLGDQYVCCITAVYGPSQALVAQEAGARYVAVYVNRATRFMGDGLEMVREIAEILKSGQTEILAASIKSTKEACQALSAGAHHLTLPLEVLRDLITHPLSEQAVAEFQEEGVGLSE